MRSSKLFFTFIVVLISIGFQSAQSQSLYKVTLLRAAPGELLSLIENLKAKVANYQELGGSKPFIVRHSQGDQWDLMVYEDIISYENYFGNKKSLINVFTPEHGDNFYSMVAFHESIFANGPSYDIVANLFNKNGYFHVEMFVALPGKQNELFKQRQMENVYLKEIGRDPNLIFTSVLGGQWDSFTLGGYRDIKHYAESADIPLEVEEKAAIKAGFKGVTDISPYLRSLITFHHDTLGGKVE